MKTFKLLPFIMIATLLVSSCNKNSTGSEDNSPPITPILHINQSSLDFSSNLVLIKLLINNSGDGSLTWNLSDNSDWLTAAPMSGSATTETDTVDVSIDRSDLSPGTYTGQIIVSSNGGTDTISVTMSVPDNATLTVSTQSLNFGKGQTVKTFDISNSGPGSINWSVSANKSWISLSPASGTVTTETDQVTATINKSGLEFGLYDGTITVTSDAGNATLSVAMEVESNVTVSVSPISVEVQLNQTQQFSAAVSGTSNKNVTWSIEPANGSGTISAGGLYTAPATLPSPATAQIIAASVADPTKKDTAAVTIVEVTGVTETEKKLCAQTFGGAYEASDLGDDANEIGVQAVFLAQATTGTLTQVAANSDQFTYSSSPSDKLVIIFANGSQMEYKFTTFNGYTDGTWNQFLNEYYHTLEYSVKIDTLVDLNIYSATMANNVAPLKSGGAMKISSYDLKFQFLISGTIYYAGEKLTLNLNNSGTNNGWVEGQFAWNKINETCLGTISSPTASISIDEFYYASYMHDSGRGKVVRNFYITNNSSATMDGTTYKFQDGYAKWESQSLVSAEPPVFNLAIDTNYWECSGALYKNGVLYGVIKFDGPVIYESHGPELVLLLNSGEEIFLHTLIQYP